ncbi:hypothetical protein PCS_01531 [Desulfocurvibacter africanus PCS]|uniref:tRNA-splicing ligase RtcB n=1 Tax=Desulfocurvibacter africanus PCS TaxID=1262666 RepID=M5Q2P7_DESAF|nr:RtcB family protein [Desulfocurvibacter africanus]EMG37593.1 hypothetical protein PCS_01531 [Desulfocurvibacter africanus PCS]
MRPDTLERISPWEWRLQPTGSMRVPGVIYASEPLLRDMEGDVLIQLAGVASLPGVTGTVYAMPDAHTGFGFPIGGVAAMDPDRGGVISAGGVGYDIACGVRVLLSGMHIDDLLPHQEALADALFATIPAGVGSTGAIRLNDDETDAMLARGAAWAVGRGWGRGDDLAHIEDHGTAPGAEPELVSAEARKRQRDEMGTLGSGNHYLEIQVVEEIFDAAAADAFGLRLGDVLVAIHCGSRGLGHQIATDYSKLMLAEAPKHKITLPHRDLACAPIRSELGRRYLGAMRAGINCALANRQILTHLVREAFERVFRKSMAMPLLYDVAHNTCREEEHRVGPVSRRLFVHRKGATRALPPGHPALPAEFSKVGQPVLVGGSMGTASYILAGVSGSEGKSLSSACHGAGRLMSRGEAKRRFQGREVIGSLKRQGILVRTPSFKGVAEEAPGAYKDVHMVIEVTQHAGLARPVAKVRPVINVKG